MARSSTYLLKSFGTLFFSIFLPIIAIGSLILFVRIAKITEVTQMTFAEMLTLYGYFIPTVLFYTLPITFFAALTLTMVRLSNDFESIVLFSFGISPARIARFFTPVTLLMTGTLLLIALALIPITKQLIKSFINYKSVHAVLNIEASQFGQKFGRWLVFLEKKDEKGRLYNIVLYNPSNPKEEEVLTAKEGRFINEKGVSGLQLEHGEAYRITHQKVHRIDFETMKIYDTSIHRPFTYRNIVDYWMAAVDDSKRRKDLILFLAVSLFPLLTLAWALTYGILHPRYDRNYAYAAIFGVTTLYYGVLSAVAKMPPIYSIIFLLAFWLVGLSLFIKKTQKRF